MLRSSFIHVPGIGPHRERRLWDQGYVDWTAFLERHPRTAWREMVAERLDEGTAARALPRRERWRLAPEFPGRTAYLDIETEGLDPVRDAVTCIGLSDGSSVEAFVQGENLGAFPAALDRFDMIVTYNGTCFDLPVLQHAFPSLDFHRLHHIDLRFPLHRLGIKGGLKGAERQVGIARSDEIAGVDGYLAVLLWREVRRGRSRARETLLRYCLEDVVNLKPLLAHAYNGLSRSVPVGVRPIDDTGVPAIPWQADAGLVRELLARAAFAHGSPP